MDIKLLKFTCNIQAAIGIGAMIVFVAMVLVAGIAASVLVNTSSNLENQALKSGQETITEVSTGIAVEEIEGHKNGDTIDELAINIRPRAGSQSIDLSETVVEISDSSTKNFLVYSSTGFTDSDAINGDLFLLSSFDGTATQFRLVVLEDADGSCESDNPVINTGDHVVICIDVANALGALSTNTDIFGNIISEEGLGAPFGFRVPGLGGDTLYELY